VKTIVLSGIIGENITPLQFHNELVSANGGPVIVDFNSPGGSVYDGLSIRRMIAEYPGRMTGRIVPLAASMAGAVLMACDEITVFSDSVFMLHRVSGCTLGGGKSHRETADYLDRLDGILAEHYSARSGKPVSEILELMDSETWLYGREIVDAGFGDTFIGSVAAADREDAITAGRQLFAACAKAAETRAATTEGQEAEFWNRLYSQTYLNDKPLAGVSHGEKDRNSDLSLYLIASLMGGKRR